MKIIINADDFGLSRSVTNAIVESFKKEIISSTSFITTCDSFEYAVDVAKKELLDKRIGIHFNLNTGKPLTKSISNFKTFCNNGEFHGNIDRYKIFNNTEKQAIYEELDAQITKLENAGIVVDHADSHHHIHTAFNIAPIFIKVCKKHNINKVRIHRNIGDIPMYKKIGKNYYNNVLINDFIRTKYFGSLEDVRKYGLYDNLEIMVHPDYDDNDVLIDRTDDLKLELPDGDFELISYKDL